jgi:DNA replication protein DnaC
VRLPGRPAGGAVLAILTSEKTLEQLVDQGTLDDALYSRLYEMTRGIELPFSGPDQRLRGAT